MSSKYNYINEFWDLILSNKTKKIELGYKKWDSFKIKFPNYKKEIIKNFSGAFIDLYSKYNIHDFELVNVEYDTCNATVGIRLYDYYEDYSENFYISFIYSGVSKFIINTNIYNRHLLWNNDIFIKHSKSKYQHRILLIDNNYICIDFKNIEVSIC